MILGAGLLVLMVAFIVDAAALGQERESANRQLLARQIVFDSLSLTIGMVNQETGLRGYSSTADVAFLAPYTSGQVATRETVQSLEAEARSGTYSTAVADVAQRVASWTAWAEARKAEVDRSGRVDDTASELDGKTRFDAFRAANDRLTSLASTTLAAATSVAAASRDRLAVALLAGNAPVVLALLVVGAVLTFSIMRPLRRLSTAADQLAEGRPAVLPDTSRRDEVGNLARALERWQAAERDKGERDLLIRELSTPALPIEPGLLLLPIIGALDPDRALQLTDQLLDAIDRHRARVVVVDLTGVPAVDSAVTDHLFQTIECCRLMGAATVVTGISARSAAAMARLGIDTTDLAAAGNLHHGILKAHWILRSSPAHSLDVVPVGTGSRR